MTNKILFKCTECGNSYISSDNITCPMCRRKAEPVVYYYNIKTAITFGKDTLNSVYFEVSNRHRYRIKREKENDSNSKDIRSQEETDDRTDDNV